MIKSDCIQQVNFPRRKRRWAPKIAFPPEHWALLSRKSTNTRRSTFPAAYSCLDAYWVYNALMSCNVPTHCLLSWIKLLILWNHCPLRDSFRLFQRNANLIQRWRPYVRAVMQPVMPYLQWIDCFNTLVNRTTATREHKTETSQ